MQKYLLQMAIWGTIGLYEYNLSFDHTGLFYKIAPWACLVIVLIFACLAILTSDRKKNG